MIISSSYCVKRVHWFLNQCNLLKILIHSSLSSIFECSIKKKAFKFLFQILLWREIDNTFFNFLIFLVKVWSENSISIPIYPGIICFWTWLFDGVTYQGGGRDRARNGEGALMSNLCLISHRRYDVDKLKVPGCSNRNLSFSGAQKKEKSITRVLQNYQTKDDFYLQELGLFFQS